MQSERSPKSHRRDPRAAVAALVAALFASAWIAVAAWGSRDSAQPLPSGSSTISTTSDAPSVQDEPDEAADEAPSMSTGQS